MSIRSLTTGVALVLVTSTMLSAAPSSAMQEWGKGPASLLMTKEEKAKWMKVNTDADAKAFVDLFWARRDRTPGTAVNEFQQEFDTRVKYADEKFRFQKTRGSMTDRGKILILLGAPSRMSKARPDTISNIQTGVIGAGNPASERTDNYPTETWYWEKERIPAFSPSRQPLEIPFIDRYAAGEYKLGRATNTNAVELMKRAAEASVASPKLTQVPKMDPAMTPAQPQQSQQVIPATVPASEGSSPAMTAFTTPSYKSAVDEFKSAKATPYSASSYLTYSEGITPLGEYYVPVQLFVPKTSALSTGAKTTLFAMVEDEKGNVVRVYEEPVTLHTTKEDYYVDKSMTLPAGKYSTTVGLAVDGKPITMSSTKMELKGLQKGASGVSPLILSNDITALKQAQMPTDPYAFGGIKVVPRGDRVFRNNDELWYFFEARNPGMAEGGAPKLQVKLEIEGTTTQGKKKVKKQAPLMEAVAEPLKGVTGHFGVGSSIPLEKFETGDYTLKLKVIDNVTKQTYNMQQDFKVR